MNFKPIMIIKLMSLGNKYDTLFIYQAVLQYLRDKHKYLEQSEGT